MKAILIAVLCCPLLALAQATDAARNAPPKAASKAEDKHRAADIARHRQMAQAHEEAARCLEAGTPEKQCHERLRESCKGVGVGQYCGMRHTH